MKLRLAANTLRLRILRSELALLERGETLRESVDLAPGPRGSIVCSLLVAAQDMLESVAVACDCGSVEVSIPAEVFTKWRQPHEVGIYAKVDAGGEQPLRVTLEKDFACLDQNDVDNSDTFEHPTAGAVC